MTASLLVVDDEAPVQQVLEQALEEAGYEVSTASDGARAIELLEDGADQLGALITDLGLGQGPTGWDVALRARRLQPALPVIYITGGRAHEWRPPWAPDGVVLLKPFTCDQLLLVVSALLDAPPQA